MLQVSFRQHAGVSDPALACRLQGIESLIHFIKQISFYLLLLAALDLPDVLQWLIYVIKP